MSVDMRIITTVAMLKWPNTCFVHLPENRDYMRGKSRFSDWKIAIVQAEKRDYRYVSLIVNFENVN